MIFQSILKIFPVQKPEPIEHIDWLLFEWKLSIDIPKKKKIASTFRIRNWNYQHELFRVSQLVE